MSDKKALLQAIAKEEALLSRLDSEREQAFSRYSGPQNPDNSLRWSKRDQRERRVLHGLT
jgi:hypothetical protein